MTFGARLDSTARVLTAVSWATVIAGVLIVWLTSQLPSALKPVLIILLLAPVIITALVQPRSYSLEHDSLDVNRLAGRVKRAWGDVTSIELLNPSALTGSRRTFASGGLHGYLGRLSSPEGPVSIAATKRSGLVVVRSKSHHPMVISPEGRDRFVTEAHESLKRWESNGEGST